MAAYSPRAPKHSLEVTGNLLIYMRFPDLALRTEAGDGYPHIRTGPCSDRSNSQKIDRGIFTSLTGWRLSSSESTFLSSFNSYS